MKHLLLLLVLFPMLAFANPKQVDTPVYSTKQVCEESPNIAASLAVGAVGGVVGEVVGETIFGKNSKVGRLGTMLLGSAAGAGLGSQIQPVLSCKEVSTIIGYRKKVQINGEEVEIFRSVE